MQIMGKIIIVISSNEREGIMYYTYFNEDYIKARSHLLLAFIAVNRFLWLSSNYPNLFEISR